MKNYKIALIGLGARCGGLYNVLKGREYVDIVAVCDVYQDRCENMVQKIVENGRHAPNMYHDYRQCLDTEKPDIAVITTSWLPHI